MGTRAPAEHVFAAFMIQKLGALRRLLRYLEVGHVPREAPASWEIAALLERLIDDTLPSYQRAACGMLLDYYYPDWRDGLPHEVLGWVVERDDLMVRRWRVLVLRRDNYTCRDCASREDLEAHHIVRWVDAPPLRVDLDNGLTLCGTCHKKRHAA